ncbi:MAG: PEGA domain-containing protein [Planctomycetes bacterium]|nr:PEGA domain-containing protein [Planctomycetota bacterium]
MAGTKPTWKPRCARRWIAAALIVLCALQGGCVYRRMTIRSDPPGALVLLDGREVGYTPYTGDFIYYGTREITLVKDGYETRTVLQPFRPPFYQILPLEFFADNLLPFQVTNRHDYLFPLERQQVAPVEHLLDRAEGLRTETQLGY